MRKLLKQISKKVCFLFFLVFILTKLTAQSNALDATGVNFSFLTSNRVFVSGTASSVVADNVYRYNNLATINGKTIYGRLTIVSLNNIIVNNLDAETSGTASWFQPLLTRSSAAVSLATFKLEFFDSETNFPVYLYNFNLNAYDVDGTTTARERYILPENEYTSHFRKNGSLVTFSNANGNTTFLGRQAQNDAITFDNTSTFYANYTRPKTSITFSMGMEAQLAGQRQFYLALGSVGGTFTGGAPLSQTGAVPPTTDLAVTQSVNNANPTVGSLVAFTINATNNGTAAATNVVVGDRLPNGYTYANHYASNGNATFNSTTGVWTVGNLANGASQTLTIMATVNGSGNYLNSAYISGNETESNTANNLMSASVNPGTSTAGSDCTTTVTMATLSGSTITSLRNTNTGVFPLVPPGSSLPNGGVTITRNSGGNGWSSWTPPQSTATINVAGAYSNSFPTTYLDIVSDGTTTGIPRNITINFGATANSISSAGNEYQYIIGIAGLGAEGNSVSNTFSVPLTVIGNADVFSNGRFSLLDGQPAVTPGQTGTVFSTSLPNGSGNGQGYTFFFVPKDVASFVMNITGGNDPHGFIFGVYRKVCTNDFDSDGVLNANDLDSDNDGILDSVEGKCAVTGFEGFDSPQVSSINNNNIQNGSTYNGWSVANLVPAQAQPFNIVRVNGAGYAPGPVNAQSGNQYLDINGAGGTLYRDVTVSTPSVLNASAFFSPREMAGVAAYSTRIEIMRVNGTATTLVAAGNQVTFTEGSNKDTWLQSSISNVFLTAGTYRIQMFIHNNGHVDSISYCFSTDTDSDGIPNYLDTDSDNDGCADALEGNENVRYNQIHSLTLPSTDSNYPYRGQIKMGADGVNPGAPSGIVSNDASIPAALGVPRLVNNAAGNPAGVGAGIADSGNNIGQGVGTSQDSTQKDAECDRCFRPATSPGSGGEATNHGITALNRAGTNGNWPMKIIGAYTALDARTKGFVINRVPTANLSSITAVEGMMVYDTTENCLKIYDGTVWSCYTKQTCDNFNL